MRSLVNATISQIAPTKMIYQEKLTGIFIKDDHSGGYTAFVEEYPEAIAQGHSLEEAEQKVLKALKLALKVRSQDILNTPSEKLTNRRLELC